MSRQGSVPTSSFGLSVKRAERAGLQRDISARKSRAELLAFYDARTLEASPLSKEDKSEIAARLGLRPSQITDELLKISQWARVKILGDSRSRLVPVQVTPQEMASHGNGMNIVAACQSEIDAMIQFQGKGFSTGTLVGFIGKNSSKAARGEGPEEAKAGFGDLMGFTRVFDIAGV